MSLVFAIEIYHCRKKTSRRINYEVPIDHAAVHLNIAFYICKLCENRGNKNVSRAMDLWFVTFVAIIRPNRPIITSVKLKSTKLPLFEFYSNVMMKLGRSKTKAKILKRDRWPRKKNWKMETDRRRNDKLWKIQSWQNEKWWICFFFFVAIIGCTALWMSKKSQCSCWASKMIFTLVVAFIYFKSLKHIPLEIRNLNFARFLFFCNMVSLG